MSCFVLQLPVVFPIQVRYVCAKVLEFQFAQRHFFAIKTPTSHRCKFIIYKNRVCHVTESLLKLVNHEISQYTDRYLLVLNYLLKCRLLGKPCMFNSIPITVTVFVVVKQLQFIYLFGTVHLQLFILIFKFWFYLPRFHVTVYSTGSETMTLILSD